ncbi:MAG: prephenate dehydratase [Acidimicrobiales bacterium]
MSGSVGAIGYFGPAGTFTEQALLTQPDYASRERISLSSIVDVLEAVSSGEVVLGFVPLENGIEGTVPITVDSLIFDFDLFIQREVFLDIHLALLANRGTALSELRSISSFPHAIAQCRKFLAANLPGAQIRHAASTAEAARGLAAERDLTGGVIAPVQAATEYGLAVLIDGIEDHPENRTRFVAVGSHSIPRPTGHDRTSIVCFQSADRPGSLYSILGQFSARGINLTKLESRPTKKALGDYCFIIDLDGHIDDELVADCMRDLHAILAKLKFLGSYPAAGGGAPELRREANEARRNADAWIASLRAQVTPNDGVTGAP